MGPGARLGSREDARWSTTAWDVDCATGTSPFHPGVKQGDLDAAARPPPPTTSKQPGLRRRRNWCRIPTTDELGHDRKMRCFVCLQLPEEIRADLDSYLEHRRHAERAVQWTPPERWHVTLAFLPDVSEVALDELQERLTAACEKRRPLEARVRGGGVFGSSPLQARVLWADLGLAPQDRDELKRLAVGARNAAAASGTVVEGGRFVPHVTLARAPRPLDVRHLLDVLDLYESPPWEVTSIDLVASHRGGPAVRHEVLETYTLGPEEEDRWWRR